MKVSGANYEKEMSQSILQLNNEIKDLSRKLEVSDEPRRNASTNATNSSSTSNIPTSSPARRT